MKRKQPMPGYYGKNIVQHAQRRFFQRKAQEADQKKGCMAVAVDGGKKE